MAHALLEYYSVSLPKSYAIRTPELCGIALKALFNDESGNPTALLFIAALENVLLDKSFL